jgi:hypothetical protein
MHGFLSVTTEGKVSRNAELEGPDVRME